MRLRPEIRRSGGPTMIPALRTPDDRLANLPDFGWRPKYIDTLPGYDGLRMAYIDEGEAGASEVFLCLHGQPSWSFLYRKMIPLFLESGARVVAPDLFGFGRSDKPVDDSVYGFHFHRNALLGLVEALDLTRITLVVQDWGGLLGLTLPVNDGFAARLHRLLVMNTTLAVGSPPSQGFLAWRAYNRANPDLAIAALMKRASPTLSDAEARAYEAPFPDARYKAGVRRFPELVMVAPDQEGVAESLAAAAFWHHRWQGQSFMAVGAADPVLGPPVMAALHAGIQGCPPPLMIAEAGHFVPEWGGPVARAALSSFGVLTT
jgi:haloalkane dehalogenase